MPKNKLAKFFAILLVASGCAEPPEKVYVDFRRVSSTSDWELPESPAITLPAIKKSAVIPARPESELFLGNNEPRIRAVEEQLRRARIALFERLRDDLQRTKLAEIRRIEREEMAKLDAQSVLRINALFEALWLVFVKHADQQFVPLVKLAQLVGFPDPKSGTESRKGVNKLQPNWAETLVAVRAQIDAIQASYYKEVAKLTADAYGELDGWLLQLKARIIELQAKALDEAIAEAEKLSKLNEEIRLADRVRKSEKLPAIPQRTGTASTPSVGLRLPAPVVNKSPVNETKIEVEVWAAGRGYQLVNSGAGRDATKEFVKWRTQFRAGALTK